MSKDVHKLMLDLHKEGNVFRLISEKEIDLISRYFRIYSYPAGTIAANPGEPLDMIGILVDGEVLLEEETEPKGNWIVQSRMARGAILAHPTMFGADPPPVRVVVHKDVTFVGMDGKSFNAFLDENPETGITFLKEMIRVLFTRFRSLAARFTGAF